MNVYDKANELAKAIKESDEFKAYKEAAMKIDGNEDHQKMIKTFLQFQYKLSLAQMDGSEPDEKLIEEFNTMYNTISNIEDIKNFLEGQMYFARMMDDVSKTISEATDTETEFLNSNFLREGLEN